MRSLAGISILPALVCACGSGPEVAPAPTAKPTTDVPVVTPVRLEPCVPAATGEATVAAYATDAEVRFCVDRLGQPETDEAAPRDCWTVAFEGGRLVEGGTVPRHDELASAFVARVDGSLGTIVVCPNGGLQEQDCETHRPKLPAGKVLGGGAAVNETNTLLAYTIEDEGGGAKAQVVIDKLEHHRLGKRVVTFGYGDESFRCGALQWLGDLVFVNASVCAGPGAIGELYDQKGKKLADVGGPPDADGMRMATWGYAALPLVDGGWAFLEATAAKMAVHDKAGALLRVIDVAAVNGGPIPFDGPGQAGWTRTPAGTLVIVTGPPDIGQVWLVDSQTGGVKKVSDARVCPAPTP